ncbi:MAG: PAS domain-containing sensor histidine kinase [Chloroflexota bacterium]|nr:PAS domain-containing sensor histidine kinase [Chloroflexota bacterium]
MDALLVIALAILLIALSLSIWNSQKQAAQLSAAETENRQLGLELKTNSELLAALYRGTSDGFLWLNADGRVVSMNDTARTLLAAEDGIGKPLREIEAGFDLQPLVDQILSQGIDSAEQIVTKGEHAFAVRAQSVGAKAKNGMLIRFDEITELQRLGRARREFVANISHELRTPIASLQLLFETITAETLNDQAFALGLLGKMRPQIDLLHQLTDELLDLALIESGQTPIKLVETRAADLVSAVADALRPQAERKRILLSVSADSETVVLADGQGIRKVLGNLVHNAIKFTNSGGRVEIRVIRHGDNVEFSVADTGIGIPASDLSRVFERFYKVDRARARGAGEMRGTGLGLAIARHIVGAHGGRIWAESAEGKGSTFFFTLPCAN